MLQPLRRNKKRIQVIPLQSTGREGFRYQNINIGDAPNFDRMSENLRIFEGTRNLRDFRSLDSKCILGSKKVAFPYFHFQLKRSLLVRTESRAVLELYSLQLYYSQTDRQAGSHQTCLLDVQIHSENMHWRTCSQKSKSFQNPEMNPKNLYTYMTATNPKELSKTSQNPKKWF